MTRNFFKRQARGGSRLAGRRIKNRSYRRNNVGRLTDLGVERLEDRRMLAAGDLDTTFDVDGWVSASFESGDNVRINAMAVQNDGKIVVAGQFNTQQFIIARFHENGALDTTFGDNDSVGGYTRFQVNAAQSAANDVAIDSATGDIYVVGSSGTNFGIARLTADGELDASFGAGGTVVTSFASGASAIARGVVLQTDGKIVVAGAEIKMSGTRRDFAVARYNDNGALDTTFDVDGKVTTNFNGQDDEGFDVTMQQVGAYEKIVVTGYGRRSSPLENDFALARYNPDGTLDTATDTFDPIEFGVGGKTTTQVAGLNGSIANALAVDAAGRIVVVGTRDNNASGDSTDLAVARYSANGLLDTAGFNPSGTGSTIPGVMRINYSQADSGSAIVIQPDGMYVVGATVQTASASASASYRFGLARIDPTSGTLDSSFGAGGLVQAPAFDDGAGPTTSQPEDVRLTRVALQPSGKIVASGWIDFEPSPIDGDYLLARYESGLVLNNIAGLSAVDEGATYTLNLTSNDSSTTQWTIDWGDGVPQIVPGNPPTVTHVYADGDNNYTITATVTNSSGTVSAGSLAVLVNNVDPTLTVNLASVVADEGTTATNSGTFADVFADTVSVAASIGTVTQSAGVWNWSYDTLDDLDQIVTITATDGDGGLTEVTFNLEVNNVNPTLAVDNAAVVVDDGQTATNSGTISDVPADTIALVASIGTVTNNGDGTWSWSFDANTDPPEQIVTIAAVDDDFGFGQVTFTLRVNPTLTVVSDQLASEGTTVNITDLGTFTDLVEGDNSGGNTIGLDANDFTAIGAFAPATNVVFDTDTLTASGGFTGMGTTVLADAGYGQFEIAVFTFSDFELDAGITITAAGSRPIALLSQGNMVIYGTIDVSATSDGDPFNGERIAGAGGGNGGLGSNQSDPHFGDAAAGAPSNSVGQWASGGGAGGGMGGRGGRAATNPDGDLSPLSTVGQPYANLSAAIQGGSGGASAGSGFFGGSGFLAGGGGGGGGIELGAAGILTVASGGQVLANGGDGKDAITIPGTGAGGGGAGGGILLHATSVHQHGMLSADGGSGGGFVRNGGGGGGGAILIVHNTVGTFNNTGGTQSALGGGTGAGSGAESGFVGVISIEDDRPAAVPVFESFDYSIEWGDGSAVDTGTATIDSPGTTVGDLVQASFDGSHTFADNGSFLVTVTITDSSGGSDTNTFTINVGNLDPTITVDQPSIAVNEGDSATNSGTFNDVPADIVSLSASIGAVTDNGDGSWDWSFNSTDGPTESQVVTITATDEDGGLSSATFGLTVDNLDPTLTVDMESITVDEGQTAANSGTFGDVPADVVSLNASVGTVINNGDGTWSWSFNAADGPTDSQVVIITATDDDGGVASVTFGLTVDNLNPTLTVDDTSVTIDEGQTASNRGTFGDVPADIVSLNASVGTVVDNGDGTWSWSFNSTDGPTESQVITITATDDDGGLSSVSFGLTVDNLDPTLTADDESVTVDEGQVTANSGTFGDVPADIVSLNASVGTVVDNGDGTWSWSFNSTDGPTESQVVTITATDDDGGLSNVTFGLTVNNLNPTLTVNDTLVTIDEGQAASNSGTYDDVSADAVTLVASIGTVVFIGGMWTWSYNGADDLAATIVSITVSDEDGGSTIATFDLTVNNVAPSLTVDVAAVSINEGQAAANSGTYADVSADSVTLTASIGTVNYSGGTWTWSYTGADGLATTGVVITASDDDGGSTIATFDITVNNAAPTLTVNSASVNVNETQTATNGGTYGDVLADTVTLTASIGTLTYSGGTWSWSYNTTDDLPITSVVITANDEDGGSTVATFSFTVNNVNPTANAGGPYFTFDDTPITLHGNGFDMAGAADPLSYAWDLDNNGSFETAGQNAVFDPQALGFTGSQTRTVNLRVTDGDGGQAIATTTVELLGVGTALIDGVLHVVGSNANDIVIITRASSNIIVLASFNDDNPLTFNESSVTEVQVRVRNGHDIVVTTPNVFELMSIDGGSGNDLLTGGGGRNVIHGGLGHDVMHGASGDDVLLGGDGNDDIFGGSGNDILVGGNDNDIVNGGTGRDVIIGSQDEDTLQGGNDEDILIGGYTSHDANVAALDAIMAIWGSAASFNARVATLTGSGGLLQAGVTVFDDNDDDTIMGNAGRDLVFGDTNPWDGAVDTIALHALQDVLVAVN